ncbi:MAG TPA: hypothetical protein VMA73_02820 [Streptosporangiaceae bacterium]|nr:hypothetical protein [Streptosporangiaceae bacterium]
MNVRTCHGEIYSGLVLDLSGLDLEEIGNVLADQTRRALKWLIADGMLASRAQSPANS